MAFKNEGSKAFDGFPMPEIEGSKVIGRDMMNHPKASAFKLDKPEEDTTDYASAKEYNKNINVHLPEIEKLTMRDGHVLIKMFKYDKDSKTRGGIIVEDVELYETGGGQMRARAKTIPWQKRGVIVKKGWNVNPTEFSKSLKPGTIVHLPSNEYKEFHVDKTKKKDIDNGYFLLHYSAIECIENE